MFYLVETEYVGPNKKDSHGQWIGDSRVAIIQDHPEKTNSSHEERIEGWCGTTNDIAVYARGAFDTLEGARLAAIDLGFTVESELSEYDGYEGILEKWISPEAARAQWDAWDWFDGAGKQAVIDEYQITSDTTDDDLLLLSEQAEGEARNTDPDGSGLGVELHGALEYFTELRDELVQERNDNILEQREERLGIIGRRLASRMPADVTEFFSQDAFDSGMGPLPSDVLSDLDLHDRTSDERWFRKFENDGYRLGLYEGDDGYYWICWWRGNDQGYVLEPIGYDGDLMEYLGIE